MHSPDEVSASCAEFARLSLDLLRPSPVSCNKRNKPIKPMTLESGWARRKEPHLVAKKTQLERTKKSASNSRRTSPEDSYECLPPVRHHLAAQPGGGRRRGFASHLSSVGKLHQGGEAHRSPNCVQRAGGEWSKHLSHYAPGHQGALRDGGPGATRLPPVRGGRPLKRSQPFYLWFSGGGA